MSLAWKRAGGAHRGKRLDALDAMLREAHTLAKALGDTSDLLYSAPRPFDADEERPATASCARLDVRLPPTFPRTPVPKNHDGN